MTRFVITPGIAFVVAMVAGACGPGQLDEDEDLTEKVERICTDLCELELACIEPSLFESHEDCEHTCLHTQFIHNDSTCGEVKRAMLECFGSQPTCELYLDTFNDHADEYTCQAEKDPWLAIWEACLANEDRYPRGEP
jgi:hypothetical protein